MTRKTLSIVTKLLKTKRARTLPPMRSVMGAGRPAQGEGEQASPEGSHGPCPELVGKVWQKEAEDILGFRMLHA